MDTSSSARYDLIRGSIEAVDLVGREVHVVADGKHFQLDVPVVCQIIMYDDRVRLRMLQPQDRVEVMYTWEDGQAVAQSIEVLSGVQRTAPQQQPAAAPRELAN